MIKTPLSTVIGGAFWTPKATIVGSASRTLNQIIKSLFANNEQGFAYDPNDLTTMWQDQAKLLPVTSARQPVWHILDKSGNNNHAFATSSATRPILRQNATTGAYYLEFDGSDDFFVTNSINFTSTDKISLFTGVRNLTDSGRMVAELSASVSANTGTFYLVAGTDLGGTGYTSLGRGTSGGATAAARNFTYLAPDTAVLSVKHDISGNLSSMRRNGVVGIDGTGNKGTGNFGNYPLYIGRRGGINLPFNGHLYSLISIGRLTTDAETTALEKFIAKNTGVTLSV